MISIYSFFASEMLNKTELGVVTNVFKALDNEGDGMIGIEEALKCFTRFPEPDMKDPETGKPLPKYISINHNY